MAALPPPHTRGPCTRLRGGLGPSQGCGRSLPLQGPPTTLLLAQGFLVNISHQLLRKIVSKGLLFRSLCVVLCLIELMDTTVRLRVRHHRRELLLFLKFLVSVARAFFYFSYSY